MDTEEKIRIFFAKIKYLFLVSVSNTAVLVLIPVFLGVAIVFAWNWFSNRYGVNTELSQTIVVTIFCILLGLPGVVFITRKEIPPIYFIALEGIPAVIIGVIWVLFCGWLTFAGLRHIIFLLHGV